MIARLSKVALIQVLKSYVYTVALSSEFIITIQGTQLLSCEGLPQMAYVGEVKVYDEM